MVASQSSPTYRSTTTAVAAVGLVIVSLYVALFAWLAYNSDYNLWSSLVVIPSVIAISVPMARRIADVEDDPAMARILVVALSLKLVGSLLRYYVAFGIYGGIADAEAYAAKGAEFAPQFRRGDFSVDVDGAVPGTGVVEFVTGMVFAITGPTTLGGFVIFGWLSFWGLYLFYRAFRIGFPEGDRRRFALLTFFLPSLLFWPSSIGKEALMILTLGTATHGVARILERHRGGYAFLVAGIVGAGLIRPHMSALICGALAIVYLRRRKPARPILPKSISMAFGVTVIIALSALVLLQAQAFLGLESANIDSTVEVLETTGENTSQGGSQFEARTVRSPSDIPSAAFTIFFRPLPFEAHNLQSLAASFEGVGLMVLIVMSIRRLKALPRLIWARSYLLFATAYSLMFVVAFSSFNNFGLLTRQRVQLLPVLLALLCLPSQGRGTDTSIAVEQTRD